MPSEKRSNSGKTNNSGNRNDSGKTNNSRKRNKKSQETSIKSIEKSQEEENEEKNNQGQVDNVLDGINGIDNQEKPESPRNYEKTITTQNLTEEEQQKQNILLAAMIERSLNPKDQIDLEIIPHGVFNIPERFFEADKAFDVFDYRVRLWGKDVNFGQLQERQMTEEEIAEKKNKGRKKKGEEEEPVEPGPDPYEGMTEEEKKHAIAEDIYKQSSIRWDQEYQKEMLQKKAEKEREDLIDRLKKEEAERKKAEKKNKEEKPEGEEPERNELEEVMESPLEVPEPFKFTFDGEDLKNLEKSVDSGGLWIYFERYPNLDEAGLQKQQKKYKGDKLRELNVLRCKGWLPLDQLQTPGSKNMLVRVQVEQEGTFDVPEGEEERLESECLPYPIEDMYIKLEVRSKVEITPLIGEIMPPVAQIRTYPSVVPITEPRSTLSGFQSALRKLLNSMVDLYNKKFKTDLTKSEEMKKLRNYTEKQKMNTINYRKEIMIKYIFMNEIYDEMRQEVEKYLLRLIHDKFEKDLPAKSQPGKEADKLLSELYVFAKKEAEKILVEILKEREDTEDEAHEDIMKVYDLLTNERNIFYGEVVEDKISKKLLNLAEEYEYLNYTQLADKRYKDLILNCGDDGDIWYKFCLYNLTKCDYIRAEEALWKAEQHSQERDIHRQTLKCCFLIKRERLEEAKEIIEEILEEDRTSILHNTFMSFMYYFYLGNAKKGRKYFDVSKRKTMRDLNLLPPKSDKPNLKDLEKLPKLADDQVDKIWMKLISFFVNHSFIELTEKAITKLFNQETIQVKLIRSSLELLRDDIDKSNEYLDSILEEIPTNGEVILRKAANSFISENFFEAEEIFFRAIKNLPELGNDFTVLLRLGFIYLHRESQIDAKIILSRAASLNPKSCMAWFGLGICTLKLGHYEESEKALRMANIFDPVNADIWGYTCLLSLADDRKLDQAFYSLEKLLSLEIENLDLVNQVNSKKLIFFRSEDHLWSWKNTPQPYDVSNVSSKDINNVRI